MFGGAIALRLLGVLWPILVLGGAYLWADNGWHNNVAQRAEKKVVQLNAQIDANAKAAHRQMELQTAVAVAEADREKEKQRRQQAAYNVLKARADALERSNLRLSAAACRLWDDIVRSANDPAAGQVDNGSAAGVSCATNERQLMLVMADAGLAYSSAVSKWQACVRTYEAVRNAK